MLVHPVSRSRLMAVLRMVAMTRGPLPVRIGERSSAARGDLDLSQEFTEPGVEPP